MSERELCFKCELCAEIAFVLDVRRYLLGRLVWVSDQALAVSQISLVKSWNIEIGFYWTVSSVAYRELALSQHTASLNAIIQSLQRRACFKRRRVSSHTCSDCHVIEYSFIMGLKVTIHEPSGAFLL